MSLSPQAPPAHSTEQPTGEDSPQTPQRPLVVTGGIAAAAAAASGLAVLTTLTAIGWITAPHVGIGSGLGGVMRTAGLLWLVAHHVGFSVRGAGRIGMLPLGLVFLPGALLAMAGRWVVRSGGVTRLRHVGYVAIAIAFPYALLAGAIAVASRTPVASPSLWQAVVAAFALAGVAGGLGAARGLAPWGRLARLMPPRPRSIVMGMLGTTAILVAVGSAMAGGSLLAHLHQVRQASDALAPGPGGAALLLLAQLAYLPNAIVWAVAYALGPGFAFGTGTVVAPTGSALGAVPVFPMLAALPAGERPAGPGWLPLLMLAMPYLAGVFGGIVTVRITPTPMFEAAPLWGFTAGTATGLLAGLMAAFSGGPLGNGRLSSVGPSGWQTGLVAVLEIGVIAAISAGVANWLILRRLTQRTRERTRDRDREQTRDREQAWDRDPDDDLDPAPAAQDRDETEVPASMVDENDDADGHRIYLNPWAETSEDGLPGLEVVDLVADRPAELGLARLLRGHCVGAGQARRIRLELGPEHHERHQAHRAQHQAQAAEHDASRRAAGPRHLAQPRPPRRRGAEPHRRRAERDAQSDDVHPAPQVAEEQQAGHAEHTQRERRPG